MKNYAFYRKLHQRGVTLELLAPQLMTTASHLSQVFNGTRGAHTRKHIAKLLTPEERALLGWNERGELLPTQPNVSTREEVPCGTTSHVEENPPPPPKK